MAEVVEFTGETRLDIEPDIVLEGAKEKLESCVVLGYDNEGELYLGLSQGSSAESLWIIEQAKMLLLQDE